MTFDEPFDFVATGRAEKVAKIVSVIEEFACVCWELDPLADAEEIARKLRTETDEARWLLYQQRTGNKRKKPPSLETQLMVIDVFTRRIDHGRGGDNA